MVMTMRKVTIKLNNTTIGKTEMTVEEVRRAEMAGFTIIELLDK